MNAPGGTRVRVGVIGVGRMGANHARVYSMLRSAELVGVADVDGAARDRVGSLYGIPTYADHRDLLPHVEAVSVAVPTPIHVPTALDCLRSGVHVLVEKPMAPDLAGAQELVNEAERRHRVLQVGNVERFNPAVQEAAGIVSAERVLAIAARRLSPPTPHMPGEDVVLDLMIHDLDIALSIAASNVRQIAALGAANAHGDLHLVMAHLEFENGILADLIASKVTQQRIRELELTTDRSFVTVNYRTRDVSVYRNASVTPVGTLGHLYRQEAVIQKPTVAISEPLYLELEHYLDCVRGGAARVRPQESVAALGLALRIDALARASAVRAR